MKFPSGQWSLEQCLEHLTCAVSKETGDQLLRAYDKNDLYVLHMEFGRWIRNTCGLWKHGTDRLVHDLVEAHEKKIHEIPSLTKGRFVHPRLGSTSAKRIVSLIEGADTGPIIDSRLAHPDNCSWALIEIFLAKLRAKREQE